MIDDYTDRVFYPVTCQYEKRPITEAYSGDYVIRIRNKPIREVTEIGVVDQTNGVTWLSSDYWQVFYEEGYINVFPQAVRLLQTGNFPNYIHARNVQTIVSYTGGFEKVPSAIKRAAILLVRNTLIPGQMSLGARMDDSLNRGAIKEISSEDYTEKYDTVQGLGANMTMSVKPQSNTLFTSDIEALLHPYIRRGIG